MNDKKLSALLAFLKTKQFLIPAALLLTFATAGAVAIKFSLSFEPPKTIEQIDIPASFNLDIDEMLCEVDPESLVVSITKPANKAEFLTTDKVTLVGKFTYKCADTPKYKYSWFLDSNKKVFSKTKNSASLDDLKAGTHTVTYTISNAYIKTTDKVTFTVKAPIIIPVVKPNQAPDAVSITNPESGGTYDVDCESGYGDYQCPNFTGTGHDPEDGSLSGSHLEWYYQIQDRETLDYGPRVKFGTGRTPSQFEPTSYYETYKIILRAIDSKGLIRETSITINLYNRSLG